MQRNDTFIITGDIKAMWLRDSTNQLIPYIALAPSDPPLADLICGAIRRQATQVASTRPPFAVHGCGQGFAKKKRAMADLDRF